MQGDDYLREIGAYRIPGEDLPYFIEMPHFTTRWSRLGLFDTDLHVLQLVLAARPTSGAVVSGTNGVRKLRFTAPGTKLGKSSAFRIFYLNLVEHDLIVLISALAKTEQDNLSKSQRNAIAAWVAEIKADLEKRSRP